MAPNGIMAAAEANDSSSDSDDDFQQSKKDGSRKRPRAIVSPTMAGIFAASLPSAEAVKEQLLMWNPQCVPRIRGSGSKHVRFSCKKEGSGCGLNVSCVKINSGLSFKMSAATYRSGNCSELKLGVQSVQSHAPSAQPVQSQAPSKQAALQSDDESAPTMECCLCSLVLNSSQIIRCQNAHVFCKGCFNAMVRNQVTGVGKARFVVSKTVHCVVCRPQIAFSMRDGSQYLSADVWTSYLSAISEADVVAEQQRFEAILKNHQQAVLSPLEQAMNVVRSRIHVVSEMFCSPTRFRSMRFHSLWTCGRIARWCGPIFRLRRSPLWMVPACLQPARSQFSCCGLCTQPSQGQRFSRISRCVETCAEWFGTSTRLSIRFNFAARFVR
jgi:hypothetical protein